MPCADWIKYWWTEAQRNQTLLVLKTSVRLQHFRTEDREPCVCEHENLAGTAPPIYSNHRHDPVHKTSGCWPYKSNTQQGTDMYVLTIHV